MINTPHNPSAMVWSKEDLAALDNLLRDTDIMLISDEVYEHMVYDGAKHLSAASLSGLAERAFVVSSFGKTYHVTGWKIGYCLAPKELMAEFRKTHQFVVFTVHTPSQHAIAKYMQLGTHNFLSDFYQAKRDLFWTRSAVHVSNGRPRAAHISYRRATRICRSSRIYRRRISRCVSRVRQVWPAFLCPRFITTLQTIAS